MSDNTKIEWCDSTWNPTSGCTPVSAGCKNCWARRMAGRQRGRNGYPADEPFRVTFHPDQLERPLHWKKPRRIAVSLMGDLFHDDVPFEWIDKIFAVMALCPQHVFMVLTKRPIRMVEYLSKKHRNTIIDSQAYDIRRKGRCPWERDYPLVNLPLPNVWIGVSIEDQPTADERLPWLLKCPAAVRFVSAEPLLGPVNLHLPTTPNPEPRTQNPPCLDWVIVGGESGPGARPMHPDWARLIRDDCNAAGVSFFFKQWGDWGHYTSKAQLCRTGDEREFPDYSRDHVWSNGDVMCRVGKKAAGRLLDGREWNELPEAVGSG